MDYKDKQDWIEAVIADKCLTPATKVYAFGIYKHMYGVKDESFPGAKALTEATGLNDSQFYKYNSALLQAGYLEITPKLGTSNTYRLLLPTSSEGRYLPPQRVGVPPLEVGGTSTEGTNTTSNTSKDTSMKDNKTEAVVADAPTASNDEIKEMGKDRYSFRFKDSSPSSNSKAEPIYLVDLSGVTRQTNPPSTEVGHEWDSRMPEDWFAIMRERPLTQEEKDYRNRRASAYMAKQRAEQEAKQPVYVGDDW